MTILKRLSLGAKTEVIYLRGVYWSLICKYCKKGTSKYIKDTRQLFETILGEDLLDADGASRVEDVIRRSNALA